VQQDRILYIGTNEQTAKLAPLKGLEPPIFLTDVYPGFFCKQSCQNEEKWGIISVSLNNLHTDMIAPSPKYVEKYIKTKHKSITDILTNIANYKSKWQKSLEGCGVCVYLGTIQPSAIRKVMIYSSNGKDTNTVVNQLVNEQPEPHSISPAEHKALYHKSLGISRWFNGEEIRCNDIFNGETNLKLLSELEDKLANRFGLDVYYIKAEEKAGRGRKSVYK